MNVPMIFLAVIICLMALYTMNRFIRRPGILSVFLLIFQFVAASVTIFSLFENVLTIPVFELFIILTGVVLPIPVIVYDHYNVYRKMKKMGVIIPMIEKKAEKRQKRWSVSSFTEKAELWKEEIHATDVFNSLTITDPQIGANIKKQLEYVQRLINHESYETASEHYSFLFSILPSSPEIAYNAGYLYCFTGKYRDSYKVLRNALGMLRKEKRPSEDSQDKEKSNKQYNSKSLVAMLHFNIGYALYNMKRYEHAIRHFQKVLKENPDLTVAYKNIASAYLELGMDDKAVIYLEKGRVDLRDDQLRIVLGSIYYSKGDTKKALEVLDEAASSSLQQLEALTWKGKAAIKENEYIKAIECFKKLISAEPQEPNHYYHLAIAQRSTSDKDGAMRTYEKGLLMAPSNSRLLYNMGTLLDELGKKEKAVQFLYKSLQGDDMKEDAFNYLGVLLGQMNRYRESVQVFEGGIRLFDKSFKLYFNRGTVLEMARRLEDAEASFDKAYELNKNDPVLIYYYTATLIKLRKYNKAIRIYKTGISNYPEDTELLYGLSKVYTYMGEKDIAVELLKKVTELDCEYLAKIRKDTDFKTLSHHSGYKSLLVS